jgi:LysR family hydrogen peroxide-inducible transcriptional activator
MPNLRIILIEAKTTQLIEQLHNGALDAALLALPIQDDYLISQPLFDDEFFLAVPTGHELTKYKTVDQTKLKQHRLLLLEEGHCLRDQSLEICQMHDISEEQDFKATGLETLRQMVKAGTGITFMPKIAMQTKEQGIEYISFTKPVPSRSVGLVWRKTTPRQQVINQLINLI